MKRVMCGVAVSVLMTGCAIVVGGSYDNGDGNAAHGSGVATMQSRPIGAVDQLETRGSVDVNVTFGPRAALSVSGDDNLVGYVHTEQAGDTLRVWVDHAVHTRHPLTVSLVSPSLHAARVSGSGDLSVNGLGGGTFDLTVSGSGDATLRGALDVLHARLQGSGDLHGDGLAARQLSVDLMGSGDARLLAADADRIKLRAFGSGDVVAHGHARTVVAETDGSGDLHLGELIADDVDLATHGSGDVTAFATQSVHAVATGSGDIDVRGNPARRDVQGRNVRVQ